MKARVCKWCMYHDADFDCLAPENELHIICPLEGGEAMARFTAYEAECYLCATLHLFCKAHECDTCKLRKLANKANYLDCKTYVMENPVNAAEAIYKALSSGRR